MRLFLQWKWYPRTCIEQTLLQHFRQNKLIIFCESLFWRNDDFFTVSFVFEDGMSKSFLQIKS